MFLLIILNINLLLIYTTTSAMLCYSNGYGCCDGGCWAQGGQCAGGFPDCPCTHRETGELILEETTTLKADDEWWCIENGMPSDACNWCCSLHCRNGFCVAASVEAEAVAAPIV